VAGVGNNARLAAGKGSGLNPRRASAMLISAMEIRSPAVSNMSISRAVRVGETPSASWIKSSVN